MNDLLKKYGYQSYKNLYMAMVYKKIDTIDQNGEIQIFKSEFSDNLEVVYSTGYRLEVISQAVDLENAMRIGNAYIQNLTKAA